MHLPLPPLARPVIAVLRASAADAYDPVVRTLVDAGITGIELTLTTPGTLESFARLRDAVGDTAALGVGTVLDERDLEGALRVGADFVVTPVIVPDVIRAARSAGVPIVPGGLTPTELHSAWQLGASAAKVFPAATVGPEYVSHLHGPLPGLPIIPSGGVGIPDAAVWLRAGATAVSLGGPLVGDALRGGSLDALRSRAEDLLERLTETESGR